MVYTLALKLSDEAWRLKQHENYHDIKMRTFFKYYFVTALCGAF